MKVLVIGVSGIIGQHMMTTVPAGVEGSFTRRTAGPLFHSLDLADWKDASELLDAWKPEVIVNLAGENRVDVVEREPEAYSDINVFAVGRLAQWCHANNAHLIHVSSQAVLDPVNWYGHQKADAETEAQRCAMWTIIRPTFVLGIRPFPAIGRENPAERMLGGRETVSVMDRWFSVSFAWDVAAIIWKQCGRPCNQVIEIGNPERCTRMSIALGLGAHPKPVAHDSIPGLAPRPRDTVYSDGLYEFPVDVGYRSLIAQWGNREEIRRVAELAAFLRIHKSVVAEKLARGFLPLHAEVTEDFRRANPQTETELLDWYRTTEAYTWELTAYHCDPGFNYAGTCAVVVERLRNAGAKRVLCLGDGVGTLTIALREAGFEPVYHDLAGSKTAAFARARFGLRFHDSVSGCYAADFAPELILPDYYDAVVSLDFLEHVPNVQEWVSEIHEVLKPGGLFCAQNAFGMASGPDGAMPMHLAVNDHWEKDWDLLLSRIGLKQEAPQWYRKL